MVKCKIFVIALFLLSIQALPLYGQALVNAGSVQMVSEKWSLPENEQMGMVGLGIAHTFTDHLRVGTASWMAVTGNRGGFIALGLDGAISYPVAEQINLESGLYIGAGGGKGGYLLSGGGLMLRTFAALNYHTERWGIFGAGVSYVDFPCSGSIHSAQLSLSLAQPLSSGIEDGWAHRNPEYQSFQYGGLSPKINSLSFVTRQLFVVSSAKTDTGLYQGDIMLIGAEWRAFTDKQWYVKLETEGAAGGGSAGYMQILAGGGCRIPLTESIFVTNDVAIGAGGGGHVDSGGGLLFDGSVGMQYYLTSHFFSDLSVAHIASRTGTFAANSLLFKLGYQRAPNTIRSDIGGAEPAYLRIRAVTQTYLQASELWRAHHPSQNVDNIGLQLDYFINSEWYATGQALAAYHGGAGAYMTGLVGAGARKSIGEKFYFNTEALAGAAGGGGLTMGSGLVWQANAGIGYDISPTLSAMVTAGRMQAYNGDFKANVIGISLDWKFRSYLKN